MQQRTHAYGAIDLFRLVAALMVVAIHTSLLADWNETADFLLTRVVARVAVPFFLMTTGFFTLGPAPAQKRRGAVFRFYRRTLALYAVAIALYLPLNVYNGSFAQPHLWQNLLKDVCVDGTFYHLWYLPASLLGVAIVQQLHKCRRAGVGWAVVLGLYGIGLLGDSYYGAIAHVPALNGLYRGIFAVCDYTRNGLFYAPVFLWMGAWLHRHPLQLSRRACGVALVVCALALCGEALSLRAYGWQRHDSMYLFLLPVMACLFSLLQRVACRAPRALRDVALAVYLIHPWMIVCVRGAAKVLGLTALLIDSSIGHFLAVALSSLLFAGLYAWYVDGVRRARQAATERLAPPQQTPPRPLQADPADAEPKTAQSTPAQRREGEADAPPQAQGEGPAPPADAGQQRETPPVQTQPAQYARRFPPRSSRRR